MTTVFIWLYELLCGSNEELSDFRDTIFRTVGLSSMLVAMLVGLLFYVVLGRWRNIWHTRVHWVLTLLLCFTAGFGLAFGIARQELGFFNGYVMLFAVMNGVVLMVYFTLSSLLLKRFSIFAKRTPF